MEHFRRNDRKNYGTLKNTPTIILSLSIVTLHCIFFKLLLYESIIWFISPIILVSISIIIGLLNSDFRTISKITLFITFTIYHFIGLTTIYDYEKGLTILEIVVIGGLQLVGLFPSYFILITGIARDEETNDITKRRSVIFFSLILFLYFLSIVLIIINENA